MPWDSAQYQNFECIGADPTALNVPSVRQKFISHAPNDIFIEKPNIYQITRNVLHATKKYEKKLKKILCLIF